LIIDTHIVQVKASSAVLKFDDIKLFDRANGKTSHSLWYCHDLLKSPTLKTAILKTFNKSCRCKCASKLFSEDNISTQNKFMGFVATCTKNRNYLLKFHYSSFVIFKTDGIGENTVVVCMLTSRHRVLSNMQDRLLQLIQIFQYVHEKINCQLIITNEDVGQDISLDLYSRDAYSIMGFDTKSLTQDRNTIGWFGIRHSPQSQRCNMAIATLGRNTVIIFCPLTLNTIQVLVLRSIIDYNVSVPPNQHLQDEVFEP